MAIQQKILPLSNTYSNRIGSTQEEINHLNFPNFCWAILPLKKNKATLFWMQINFFLESTKRPDSMILVSSIKSNGSLPWNKFPRSPALGRWWPCRPASAPWWRASCRPSWGWRAASSVRPRLRPLESNESGAWWRSRRRRRRPRPTGDPWNPGGPRPRPWWRWRRRWRIHFRAGWENCPGKIRGEVQPGMEETNDDWKKIWERSAQEKK